MNRKLLVLSIVILTLIVGGSGLRAQAENTGPAGAHAAMPSGLHVAWYSAQTYTDPSSGHVGRTLYASDHGNKQLEGDFVPNDPERHGGTNNITYYVDRNRPSADVSVNVSEAAIDRAMATWDAQTCSNLGMTKLPFSGVPTGFVSALFGYGGTFDYIADVVHAGWLPGSFFDLLEAGGSDFILGVTFTIVYVDNNGNYVDSDGNGKYDVAWREIYFNDKFPWADGANYDIQTVALHESGHGLSQAHFGDIFRTPNGKLVFAPLAVMNAAYSGIQRSLTGSDKGGHCSNWAQWPNN